MGVFQSHLKCQLFSISFPSTWLYDAVQWHNHILDIYHSCYLFFLSYLFATCIYLSLQGEEDEENDGDQDEEGDGFFVPHGYLSEDEGCDNDDDEGKVMCVLFWYL